MVCSSMALSNGSLAISYGGIFEGLSSISTEIEAFVSDLDCSGTENNMNHCSYQIYPETTSGTQQPVSVLHGKRTKIHYTTKYKDKLPVGVLCRQGGISNA